MLNICTCCGQISPGPDNTPPRSYNTSKSQYQAPVKEEPSTHKRSLIKELPAKLISDTCPDATVFINNNFDLIFKTSEHSCYYSDVSNARLAKYSTT